VSKCYKCGHDMRLPDGTTIVGVSFSATQEGDNDIRALQPAVPRHRVPFRFEICFSCLLEAFGIKPDVEP